MRTFNSQSFSTGHRTAETAEQGRLFRAPKYAKPERDRPMQKYKNILRYARPHWLAFSFIFAVTASGSLLAALQPWPLKLIADNVLGHSPLPSALDSIFRALSLSPTPRTILALSALGGLALFALNSALNAASTWAWTLTGRRMVYELAEDLFARFQRRSLLFHSRNSVGDVISRITGDSWCVYQIVDTLVMTPCHAVLTTLAMVFFMAHFDLRLTIVALITAPLMGAVSLLAGKPLRAVAKLKREVESRIQSHIQQTLSGIPVVQAFGQEEREHRRFREFTETSIRLQQRSVLIGSFNRLGSGLVTTAGSGVILWLGAWDVLNGRLDVGSLMVFVFYLHQLQSQFKLFAGVYTTAQGLSANVNRINEVLEARPEIGDRPGAVALSSDKGRGHVQIEGVTFGYEPGRPVLHQVSVEGRPGQTIAIVGPTGAGKSTLISLIPRFNDPWTGRVVVDGQDVREVQLKSLRDQVALVLQEPYLFPFSVAENIAYGRPDATRKEIEEAARAANAHSFILRLPEGYDTALGEHGATLSGGERQRLGIARALLKGAPILILDEPTSALDVETEALLMEAVERLMKGRTTFIIAHRLSTVRRAHCIVALREGAVVESGKHEDLLARGEYYARLYAVQFEGQTSPALAEAPRP